MSQDVERMAQNVNDFIDSLNSSLNNRSNRLFIADKTTTKFPSNSNNVFNETRNFNRPNLRERSPNFQEKMVDTQELEVYRQMFDKPKTPIYYEKETDTRELNEINNMERNKKIVATDSGQQTVPFENREESPVFNKNLNRNNNIGGVAHNIKDLYKAKNKYGYKFEIQNLKFNGLFKISL